MTAKAEVIDIIQALVCMSCGSLVDYGRPLSTGHDRRCRWCPACSPGRPWRRGKVIGASDSASMGGRPTAAPPGMLGGPFKISMVEEPAPATVYTGDGHPAVRAAQERVNGVVSRAGEWLAQLHVEALTRPTNYEAEANEPEPES